MLDFLRNKVAKKEPHCLTNAIIDFAIMGVQTGWKVIKWSQPTCPKKAGGFYIYDKPTNILKNTIFACCIEDFTFKFNIGKLVTDPLNTPNKKMQLVVSTGDLFLKLQYGETLSLLASPKDQDWCFVCTPL